MNTKIDEFIAKELITAFLSYCLNFPTGDTKLPSVRSRLWKDVKNWAPKASVNIQRSSWKNPAYGKAVLDPDTLDALLVNYINYVYLPGNLGLLVEHIRNF